MPIRLAMLGDIVGMPGVNSVCQLAPTLRKHFNVDLVIANAENAHEGSGITPALYRRLIDAGVDGITLGDHAYRRMQIKSVLESQQNIIRPANLPSQAMGRLWMQLAVAASDKLDGCRSRQQIANPSGCVYVITVLGRVFPTLPADDPFKAAQSVLAQLPDPNPIVLLEVHAEATSEKQAIAHYFDGKVAAVVGSHTHVPTADARILPHGTAYITDLGMCGPHHSIIGRRIDRVLAQMTTAMPAPFDVAHGDPRLNGVIIEIDTETRRATSIERLELQADPDKPPFIAGPS